MVKFCCFDIMLTESLIIGVESTVTETFFNSISICLHLDSNWAHRSFCILSNNLLPCVLDIGAGSLVCLDLLSICFHYILQFFWNFAQNRYIWKRFEKTKEFFILSIHNKYSPVRSKTVAISNFHYISIWWRKSSECSIQNVETVIELKF